MSGVLLIYTGGTIGMIENSETGALESFNFDHLLNHVPELKRFNYHIATYQFTPTIDSSDMEPALWAKLVHIINDNYDKFDGFVILHGTDTMAYTASALSFMLENLSKRLKNLNITLECDDTVKKALAEKGFGVGTNATTIEEAAEEIAKVYQARGK